MNSYKNAYRGYYKGQYYRSYIEFLYALKLEFIEQKRFHTEGVRFISNISQQRKVPDFVVLTNDGRVDYCVEIKPSQKTIEQLIVDYSVHNYNYHGVTKFVKIDRKVKAYIVSQLRAVMGSALFESLSDEFKNQRVAHQGFSKELNPMWGRKHSLETIKKIKSSKSLVDTFGQNNPNFGKQHTEDAKRRIGAKWHNQEMKISMMRKGMLTHISRMDDEQRREFISYAISVIGGNECERPLFLNPAYTVSINKINKLFGDARNFFNQIGAEKDE